MRYLRGFRLVCGVSSISLLATGALAQTSSASPPEADHPAAAAPASPDDHIDVVTVTAQRRQLLGTATTSSQGVVVKEELALTPSFRPAQILETVPGLVVTAHSGEGKANQYELRGFSLDHGTDLATFVDDIPINQPTHAHGQGYTDLNFLIPEVVERVDFTKGPYFAAIGDFGAVGSVHIHLVDAIPAQVTATAGNMGYQRLLGAGSEAIGGGNLLAAVELQHYGGPWDHPDNQRKINSVLRYSDGDETDGYSVTAMFYHDLWNATTDQPVRAMDPAYMASLGLKPIDRWGSLDPSDGGSAEQIHVSGQYHAEVGSGHVDANVFSVYNRMTLWNDFTHYLYDPVNGDQEAQNDHRFTLGGGGGYSISTNVVGFENDFLAGVQTRYDEAHVSHFHTKNRVNLSVTDDDRANITSLAAYAQATTHWTDWMRTVLGVREDYQTATVKGSFPGSVSQAIFQPKASLIISPWGSTEFYISAGRGFHSDDARGVTQAKLQGLTGAPLLAHATSEEVGVRTSLLPNLTATVTAFRMDFQSETTYDPDIGQDAAGPPSHRQGIEMNTTFVPLNWLEFYTSFAASHARYTVNYDDGTGHVGRYIPNAPNIIANVAGYVRDLGPWSGGVEWRYLGHFPLTPDNVVKGKGYSEVNLEANYTFPGGFKLGAAIYNLLDTHANAAEFWYTDRLPGEPAGGVSDLHVHPLEPRAFRFTVSKTFL